MQALLTEEQRVEYQRQLLNECKEETAATEDDIKTVLAYETPKTRSAKCLLSCAIKKLEIVRILQKF